MTSVIRACLTVYFEVSQVWQSIDVSDVAMDHLACQMWRSNGVPKVKIIWRIRSADEMAERL